MLSECEINVKIVKPWLNITLSQEPYYRPNHKIDCQYQQYYINLKY